MRVTRAYLASLGTTGLLLLAAFAVLIAASALIAFNGWPGDEAPEQATPVLVDPGRDTLAGGGPGDVAAEAAEVADDVALLTPSAPGEGGSGDGDGQTPGPGGPPGGGAPDRTREGPGPAPDAPQQPTDSPPGGGGQPEPEDRGGIELPGGGTLLPQGDVSLTDGLADGLESTTSFLGDETVEPISAGLGSLVTDTGEALTDLVRGLDGTGAARP